MDWFDVLIDYLKTELNEEEFKEFIKDPLRFFNCDESGFPLQLKKMRVLAKKGSKNVFQQTTPGHDQVTVLACFNAGGMFCSPLVVFKGERLRNSGLANFQGAIYSSSKKGWMQRDIFFCFVQDLLAFVKENGIKLPIILFMDSHSSHLTRETSEFCADNRIILYCLPSHSSHVMQPLDVGFFKSLKANWKKRLLAWQRENPGVNFTKSSFPGLFKKCWEEEVLDPNMKEKAANGFKRCGLFPINPKAVDQSNLVADKENTAEGSTSSVAAATTHATNKETEAADALVNLSQGKANCTMNGKTSDDKQGVAELVPSHCPSSSYSTAVPSITASHLSQASATITSSTEGPCTVTVMPLIPSSPGDPCTITAMPPILSSQLCQSTATATITRSIDEVENPEPAMTNITPLNTNDMLSNPGCSLSDLSYSIDTKSLIPASQLCSSPIPSMALPTLNLDLPPINVVKSSSTMDNTKLHKTYISPAFDKLQVPCKKKGNENAKSKRKNFPKAASGAAALAIFKEEEMEKKRKEVEKIKRKIDREKKKQEREAEKIRRQLEREELKKIKDEAKMAKKKDAEKRKARGKIKRAKKLCKSSISIDSESDADTAMLVDENSGSDTSFSKIDKHSCYQCGEPVASDIEEDVNVVGCDSCPRWAHKMCTKDAVLMDLTDEEDICAYPFKCSHCDG